MEERLTAKKIRQTLTFSCIVTLLLKIGTCYSVEDAIDPVFIKTPTNITVHEGDLAVLKCHIANLGPKMVNVVVWRKVKEDYPLTIGQFTFSSSDEMSVDHTRLSPTSSTWDLLIKNVKPHHAGVYECQVSANHLIAQYVTLNVVEPSEAKSDLVITGTQFVNMGSPIRLICNASGTLRAPEAVDWFYEGNSIHPLNPRWRGRVEILKHSSFEGKYYISELIVHKSTMEDKGHFVCRSSDLTVGSIKVHVLNADKDNLTRRGSEKDSQSGQAQTDQNSSEKLGVICHLHFLIFGVSVICKWCFSNLTL